MVWYDITLGTPYGRYDAWIDSVGIDDEFWQLPWFACSRMRDEAEI